MSSKDIAAAAEVSVPTFYAYVPSKAALMVALYAHDRAIVHAAKQALIEEPGDDAAEAITRLLIAEIRDGQDYLGHEIWREIVATSIRRRGDYQAGLDELNRRVFDEPVERLLRALQQRGLIAVNADLEGVVAMLSDLLMAVFHQELAKDHDWNWVEQRLRRHVTTLLAGLRPAPGESNPDKEDATRPG